MKEEYINLLKELPNIDSEYTIAVLPDHPTPIDIKTHTMTPIPFAIYSTNIKEPDDTEFYSEDMSKGKYDTIIGHTLLSEMIKISKE